MFYVDFQVLKLLAQKSQVERKIKVQPVPSQILWYSALKGGSMKINVSLSALLLSIRNFSKFCDSEFQL